MNRPAQKCDRPQSGLRSGLRAASGGAICEQTRRRIPIGQSGRRRRQRRRTQMRAAGGRLENVNEAKATHKQHQQTMRATSETVASVALLGSRQPIAKDLSIRHLPAAGAAGRGDTRDGAKIYRRRRECVPNCSVTLRSTLSRRPIHLAKSLWNGSPPGGHLAPTMGTPGSQVAARATSPFGTYLARAAARGRIDSNNRNSSSNNNRQPQLRRSIGAKNVFGF